MLKKVEPGRPWSRAKAQSILEAAVKTVVVAKMIAAIKKVAIPVAPPFDPVAWVNISRTGNLVGVFTASSTLPIQNRVAISIPKPRTPLIAMLSIRLWGTAVDAD